MFDYDLFWKIKESVNDGVSICKSCNLKCFDLLIMIMFFKTSFLPPDNIDDEDGEFKNKEERDHRHVAETEKLRVTWNTERRSYMDAMATKR